MNRPVIWSGPARTDYLSQLQYIRFDNPIAAQRVGERIAETARHLGFTSTGRPGRVAGTYEKVVTGSPYIIAYEIGTQPNGEECIIILRLIHGARNWPPDRWPD